MAVPLADVVRQFPSGTVNAGLVPVSKPSHCRLGLIRLVEPTWAHYPDLVRWGVAVCTVPVSRANQAAAFLRNNLRSLRQNIPQGHLCLIRIIHLQRLSQRKNVLALIVLYQCFTDCLG